MPLGALLLLCAAAPTLAWRVEATAQPADDLQAAFERLPAAGQRGWMGGDAVLTAVVRGPTPSSRRFLWFFSDTFVTEFKRELNQRTWPIHFMRSSVGLSSYDAASASFGTPTFSLRNWSGVGAPSFWPLPYPNMDEWLWPQAVIASRDGTQVLATAVLNLPPRLCNFSLFCTGGTSTITLSVGASADPTSWSFTTHHLGGTNLSETNFTWNSGLVYEKPDDGSDDSVLIFGRDIRALAREDRAEMAHTNGAGSGARSASKLAASLPVVVARSPLSRLLKSDWSAIEYWSAGGQWAATPAAILPIRGLAATTSPPFWSAGLRRFCTFDYFAYTSDNKIDLWTAVSATGPWQLTPAIFQIPAPFNGKAVPGDDPADWLCYDVRGHPELERVTANGTVVELALNYICNSWPADIDLQKRQLFDVGGMALPLRGYWPRFVRVTTRLVDL